MQQVKSIQSDDGARRLIFCDGGAEGFAYWEEVHYTDRDSIVQWIPFCWPRTHCPTLEAAMEMAAAEFEWAAKLVHLKGESAHVADKAARLRAESQRLCDQADSVIRAMNEDRQNRPPTRG